MDVGKTVLPPSFLLYILENSPQKCVSISVSHIKVNHFKVGKAFKILQFKDYSSIIIFRLGMDFGFTLPLKN